MESIRVLVNDRLAAAANEICRVFESTIAEYQEEICRSKQEIEQLRSVKETVLKIQLTRTDSQQLSISAEIVPEHQQETPGLDREHPELKLKEENEELCISQRKVLLIPTRKLETPYMESFCDQGKDNSSHVVAGVKYRETDEPLPSSSTVSQIKTEPGEEDCKLTEVTEPISGNLLSSAAQSEHTLTTLTAEKELSVKKNKRTMSKKSNLNPPSQDTQSSYSCKVCGLTFHIRGFLFRHAKEHTDSCAVCGESFESGTSLKDHLPVHIRELNMCNVCKKPFSSSTAKAVHMRIHTGEKPYKCTFCGMSFPQIGGLVLHNLKHTGEKPYSCDVCAKCFVTKSTLKRHKDQNCVTPQLENYDSVQAGENHDSVQPGQSHDSVQAGENLLRCSVCNYGVNTSAEMEVHTEKHMEGKHGCHVCGKVYTTRQQLTVHFRVHTGNKPYSCTECGKCFKTNKEMKVHLRIHTGERPYCCTCCNMRFKQSAHLVWHMRGHTGEKPYSCSLCGKCFKTAAEKNRHMKVMKNHMSHMVETVSF